MELLLVNQIPLYIIGTINWIRDKQKGEQNVNFVLDE